MGNLSRFWDKVLFTTDCWEWAAVKNIGGYGRFTLNGKKILAHRFSYELYKGKIPNNLHLDHLCRNRACVNPDHLEPVTHLENIRRGLSGKINNRNAEKTHCPQGHEYTGDNLILLNHNHRRCRICKNKTNIKYRFKLKYDN